jgi:hypothetical protein
MEKQAIIWCRKRKLEDAKSEASNALEIYEKLGATKDVEDCRILLQEIEEAMNNWGEFLKRYYVPPLFNSDTSQYEVHPPAPCCSRR